MCPKVKKLLSDDTISDEQHDLEQLEKSLKKSIRDNFDYLPRKYRYTVDSKNQHIMTEAEYREKMRSLGWSELITGKFIKLHDIQEEKHNTKIPFNYYLLEDESIESLNKLFKILEITRKNNETVVQ